METQIQPKLDFILNGINCIRKEGNAMSSPWKKNDFIEYIKKEMIKEEMFCHSDEIIQLLTLLERDNFITYDQFGITPTPRGKDKVERKIGFQISNKNK